MHYLFNNSEMDGLSYGFVFTFLFWLHGKLFSHVNIAIAAFNWVGIVVPSPFRTLDTQPVINIRKGNWILKKKRVFSCSWMDFGLLVPF